MSKADDYNQEKLDNSDLDIEHITAMVRCWQESHGLDPDGYCGPMTLTSLNHSFVEDGIEGGEGKLIKWKPWDGPLERQAANMKELYAQFGDPAGGVKQPVEVNKAWKKENIIELHHTHNNKLPGAPHKQYIHFHKIAEPYLREALRRAKVACPEYVIERLGSFNFRSKRGDSNASLSMHAFGLAVDVDPERNFVKHFDKGEGPVAWSDEYNEIWDEGVPRAFVEAFQSCGFAWGSDWDEDGKSPDHTFYDPMHFEFRARDGVAHLV